MTQVSPNSPGSLPIPPLIHIVGMGLGGARSLSQETLPVVESATLLIGAQRHLDALSESYPSDIQAEQWPLGDFSSTFDRLRSHLCQFPETNAVILATGDPLFFGIGRLLLTAFPAEQLVFHPQVSAIQLAFSRIKCPWQDATLLSLHGRSEETLIAALKQGNGKIAILTDPRLTPNAVANILLSLDLRYQIWVCENLGSSQEKVSCHTPEQAVHQPFAPLNVVVLLKSERADRQSSAAAGQLRSWPIIGLPDRAFQSFPDRPALMTKREIRLLILGALAPYPLTSTPPLDPQALDPQAWDPQVFWDIGAGTGSVAVELSRLCPHSKIYAIEKTAMGTALIRQNAHALGIAPIEVVQGEAPAALEQLPSPDSVFIGGSGGQLIPVLNYLHRRLAQNGSQQSSPKRVVLAIAAIETLSQILAWVNQPEIAHYWQCQLTQANISKSVPVGPLTRFSPLNPITLATLETRSH